ncbi:MAG TPA: nuclear transport factor 2 family protein [Kofleriaceae bacterium]|nr:nuclear transport factor 2 family protein [Kofleriaceae bacterium]
MSRIVLALALLLAPSVALADDGADVGKAFTSFVDGVARGQPGATTGVDLFITPGDGDVEDGFVQPVTADLAETRGMIAGGKLKVNKVVVSKSARSAWIAGEVPGAVKRKGKVKKEPVRVSAFLFKDDKGWHVQATHWSTGEPDRKTDMCGDLEEWRLEPRIAPAAKETVKAVFGALEGDALMEGGVTTGGFAALLSADKNAYVIGSAPKETFVGGAKIKSVFKKWKISAYSPEDDAYLARATVGPDGEMMWVALSVIAPPQLCTSYRTLFVLAREAAGWRIVHQHYSSATNPF